MSEKIVPVCRYGHGDLIPITENGKYLQWFALSALDGLANPRRGYSFAIFKCPKCSYLELHDDGELK